MEVSPESTDEARYNPKSRSIYVARASDGDNLEADTPACVRWLRGKLLQLVQYFSCIEITDHHQNLWPRIWTDASSIIDCLLFAWRYISECEERYGIEVTKPLPLARNRSQTHTKRLDPGTVQTLCRACSGFFCGGLSGTYRDIGCLSGYKVQKIIYHQEAIYVRMNGRLDHCAGVAPWPTASSRNFWLLYGDLAAPARLVLCFGFFAMAGFTCNSRLESADFRHNLPADLIRGSLKWIVEAKGDVFLNTWSENECQILLGSIIFPIIRVM